MIRTQLRFFDHTLKKPGDCLAGEGNDRRYFAGKVIIIIRPPGTAVPHGLMFYP